jgi:CheY-like chemotaxis protein
MVMVLLLSKDISPLLKDEGKTKRLPDAEKQPIDYNPFEIMNHENSIRFVLSKMNPIKILIVDDQPDVRKGLKMLLALESDLQVTGEASDGPTALQQFTITRPDVVVMDLELPGIDGITTAEALRRLDPRVKVIMLSIHADPAVQERAREAGVIAYVEKRDGASRLIQEIRSAFARC